MQLVVLVWRECISIHAPCMGAMEKAIAKIHAFNFKSRSQHGARLFTNNSNNRKIKFQFTLPVWGATNKAACFKVLILNFNSRSLHGERSFCVSDTLVHTGISILASFMGSDLANFLYDSQHSHFNSRSPYGERWTGGDSYDCV